VYIVLDRSSEIKAKLVVTGSEQSLIAIKFVIGRL